jgi:energy-converting hydrogenase Eha subunit H
MLLSADIMRLFLFLCLLGMPLLAAMFLRRRRLSLSAYFGWGLLILLVPLIGPFLVILTRPGKQRDELAS